MPLENNYSSMNIVCNKGLEHLNNKDQNLFWLWSNKMKSVNTKYEFILNNEVQLCCLYLYVYSLSFLLIVSVLNWKLCLFNNIC